MNHTLWIVTEKVAKRPEIVGSSVGAYGIRDMIIGYSDGDMRHILETVVKKSF